MIPQAGDVILVKGKGVISEAIDFVEGGIYSHVAIYAGDGWVLEAQGGRTIGYRRLSDYADRYDIGVIRKGTVGNRTMALVYAHRQEGQGYGWKLLFFMFLKLVLRYSKPYNKAWGEVCSKYVCDAWLSAGVDLCPGNDKPTPQDVADSSEVQVNKLSEAAKLCYN